MGDSDVNDDDVPNAHQSLASMAKAEGQARVRDEVRKAVSAAEEARVGVVCKPLLCPLDGGLEGQGRCAALLILHTHSLDSDACESSSIRANTLLRASKFTKKF